MFKFKWIGFRMFKWPGGPRKTFTEVVKSSYILKSVYLKVFKSSYRSYKLTWISRRPHIAEKSTFGVQIVWSSGSAVVVHLGWFIQKMERCLVPLMLLSWTISSQTHIGQRWLVCSIFHPFLHVHLWFNTCLPDRFSMISPCLSGPISMFPRQALPKVQQE